MLVVNYRRRVKSFTIEESEVNYSEEFTVFSLFINIVTLKKL